VQLRERSRGAAVVLHLAQRRVARAVGDPHFVSVVGERDGHEGRARVVRAHAATVAVVLEELGAIDPRELQVRAIGFRHVENGVREEDERRTGKLPLALFAVRLPGAQQPRNARGQLPEARVPRLVLVEVDGAELEVEVLPLEVESFVLPVAFTMQVAPQHAQAQLHLRARHELRVLARVDAAPRLRGPRLREPALRQRVVGDELQREDREVEDPVEQLGDVETRAGIVRRGEAIEHDLPVVGGEIADQDALHVGVDVLLEEAVDLARSDARLHVIAVLLRELAVRPHLADVLDGGIGQERVLRDRRAPADGIDGVQKAIELLALRPLASLFEELQRHVRLARGAESLRDVVHDRLARLGLLLGLADGQRDALAAVLVEGDGGVPDAPRRVDGTCRLARHVRSPLSAPRRTARA
jgi:hypothetical protein